MNAKDSKPDFPQPVQAPKGAPNIVLVLLDDVGFGASSTFGEPIDTPTLDRLAKRGPRYNQFHTTEVVLPEGGEQGVLMTQGGLSAGYALTFSAGKPVFPYNWLNVAHVDIAAGEPLAPGKHSVAFDFKYDGGGVGKGGPGTLSVDGKEVARGRIPNTVPARFSFDETFDVGEDTGTPVSLDYDVPFKFTGQIEKVVVSLGGSKLSAAEGQKTGIMERTAQRANQ